MTTETQFSEEEMNQQWQKLMLFKNFYWTRMDYYTNERLTKNERGYAKPYESKLAQKMLPEFLNILEKYPLSPLVCAQFARELCQNNAFCLAEQLFIKYNNPKFSDFSSKLEHPPTHEGAHQVSKHSEKDYKHMIEQIFKTFPEAKKWTDKYGNSLHARICLNGNADVDLRNWIKRQINPPSYPY